MAIHFHATLRLIMRLRVEILKTSMFLALMQYCMLHANSNREIWLGMDGVPLSINMNSLLT